MELNYSNNVQKLREDLNITKAQMARDLDISRKCILQIETGKQNVSLYLAYIICDYLGKDLPDVFPQIERTPYYNGGPPDYVVEVRQ